MAGLPLLAFHVPFMDQSFVLLVIGLLLFGKRLPEVGRSLGQGIVQFKKGLAGIEEEVEQAVKTPAPTVRVSTPAITQSVSAEGFKYDPITGQPIEQPVAVPPGAKFDPFTGKPVEAKESESVPA